MKIANLEKRLSKLNPKSIEARKLRRRLDKLGVGATVAPVEEAPLALPKAAKKKRTTKKKST